MSKDKIIFTSFSILKKQEVSSLSRIFQIILNILRIDCMSLGLVIKRELTAHE